LDYLCKLVGIEAQLAAEHDQLAGLGDHDAALKRGSADRGPATATELQQTFFAECSERTQNGVGVDVKDRREVSGWRQPVTWTGLSFGDRTPDRRRDLLV